MVKIHEGMGEEIIAHMDNVLSRPDMMLICARYDSRPGAIQAFYVNNQGNTFFMYLYKLREEIKNPRKDTAHLAIVEESKVTHNDLFKFLADPKAPFFRYSKATFFKYLKLGAS